MAKNILQHYWTGTVWEELYPITKSTNVFTESDQTIDQLVATKEDSLPSGDADKFLRGSDKTFVSVTKGNVGLGSVDNTADSAKPISSLQQDALNLKADKTGTYASLRAQATTQGDVGLGNVDNTSDSNKPVSDAQATAIDLKADKIGTYASLRAQATTKADVGLSNLDNLKQVNAIAAGSAADPNTTQEPYIMTNHVNNPTGGATYFHIQTLFYSTLTGNRGQIAIDYNSASNLMYFRRYSVDSWSDWTKANAVDSVSGRTGAITLTKTDVGLGNVDNTTDANKPVSTAQQTALNTKENTIVSGEITEYWRGDKTWQALTKTSVGLSNVTNTSDANKPVSTAQQTALDLKADKDGTYASLRAQATTKGDVGLGNVDNTSDADKPVSTAQGAAIALKQNTLPSGTFTQFLRGNDKTFVTVTKSNVGLGNVDNTSDENKPVSTAQQIALNTKENTIVSGETTEYWRGDKTWQALTKTSVGLGSVDNTSDIGKPVSTDQQAALDLKANQNGTYASLRAQATTKDDVDLGNVDNKSSSTIRSELTSLNVTNALTYTPISNSLFNAYDASGGDYDNGTDNIMLLCPASTVQNVLGTLWMQRASVVRSITKVDILYGTTSSGHSSTSNKSAQLHVTQDGTSMGVFTIEIFDVGGTDYIGLRRQGDSFFLSEAIFIGKSSYTGGLFCTWYTTPGGTINIPSSGSTDIGNSLRIDGVRKDNVWDAKVNASGTYADLRAQATTKTDVGLGNVDNTSDVNKPVSTDQQTALDLKANQNGTYASLRAQSTTKDDVGLSNVDNNKQMPIGGGTFTGVSVAQTNTSYATRQIRNVILSTFDPSGGDNGDIWIKYTV